MPPPTTRALTVFALVLSAFLSAMEATVVGTAMPTVIADLGGIERYGWVGSGYLLASTVTVPIFGKLADLYGRKPTLLVGIGLFLIGSLASGSATSIDTLIAARVLQGLGAGALQPVTMTIIGDLYRVEERGRVQGLFGAVWGSAAVAGPLVGGAIVALASWRWVFWINVPFGLAAAALLTHAYREPRREARTVSIDWAGALALSVSAVALLLAAGGELVWLTLPVGLVGVAVLLWIERGAREPMLPLDLLSRRPIAVGAAASALLGASMMGSVMFVPLHVQGALGASPTDAGATIGPMLLGWPIASAISTRFITRTGFRAPVWAGSIVIAVSLVGFVLLARSGAGVWPLRGAMFAYGLGMGLANTSLLIAVQAGVEHSQRGVATANTIFSRSMGGALGVGALGAMLAARLGEALPAETVTALLDVERRASVASDPAVAAALADAIAPLFVVCAALGVLNLVAVAFYPRDTPLAAAPEAAQGVRA